MKIKKGDFVKILSGKDRGKTGAVKFVFPKTGKAIVEGINLVVKHEKKKSEDKKGGLVRMEAALPLAKLQLMDPKDNKPTRVGFKLVGDKKVRITKKNQTELK